MTLNPFSLEGKTILVTGASSGIGRAVAIECSNAGANVILTARNSERLQETLLSLKGEGHCVFPADLSNINDVGKLVHEIPFIDGVVCCAGAVQTILFKFVENKDYEKLFETNVFSNFKLLKSLFEEKKLNKSGSVVIISSVSGVYCGAIGGSIYGSTKGAIEGFTKGLALEMASRKIRVNTIAPGVVETPIFDNSAIDQSLLEEDKKKYPLKRYGKPEEIGYAAVYLLSDATVWMTGSSLKIDGGYTLQ